MKKVAACGLGIGQFPTRRLVKACAGKRLIKPLNWIIEINSTEVTEYEFNQFCSKAIYLEACITIERSNYKNIRCPHLHRIKPCRPGRPVFKIHDNRELVNIEISSDVTYETGVRVFEVTRNPKLSITVIHRLKKICTNCEITAYRPKCSRLGHIRSFDQLVRLCSGESIIITPPGTIFKTGLTELKITRLLAVAEEVRMCLDIQNTNIKHLVFPKLKRWKSCAPNKAALTIVNNYHLKELRFNACEDNRCIERMVIRDNIELHEQFIQRIRKYCFNCHLKSYVPGLFFMRNMKPFPGILSLKKKARRYGGNTRLYTRAICTEEALGTARL
ncbi:hypothetical protein COOONC_11365 [Cooperia oncophora]